MNAADARMLASTPRATPSRPAGLDLPEPFLADLILKHLLRSRELSVAALAERTALPPTLVEALLTGLRERRAVEVTRRGTLDSQVTFTLTDLGRSQADEAMALCQYTGVAPVSLAEYFDRMAAQGIDPVSIDARTVRAAMAGLVVSDDLFEYLGSALNSGRATYLYGPSGSGKTSLAERLLRAIGGSIAIPHALFVGDQVILLFDPSVHRPIDSIRGVGGAERSALDRQMRGDSRWITIERPVVIAGGELTLEALELEFDPVTKIHSAPPHMKANGGLLIIDDLGRQRVSPRELMNRWIVPLDRRKDYLSLSTGVRIEIPFSLRVVFSSNLSPEELADPAFVRRLGYKIYVGPMKESAYRSVVRSACAKFGLTIDDAMIDYLVRRLHVRDSQPLLPAFPFDLFGKLCDRARYIGVPAVVSREQLDWAWQLYFGTDHGSSAATVTETMEKST